MLAHQLAQRDRLAECVADLEASLIDLQAGQVDLAAWDFVVYPIQHVLLLALLNQRLLHARCYLSAADQAAVADLVAESRVLIDRWLSTVTALCGIAKTWLEHSLKNTN